VVGFINGSRGEVPGKRKHVIREHNNNNNNIITVAAATMDTATMMI
jgi:hypothetical protein